MSIYSDKLAHVQAVINCRYSVAQMCTWEDTHAHLFMFTSGELSLNRVDLRALTLVGPMGHKPVLSPLAVHHLENRLCMCNDD